MATIDFYTKFYIAAFTPVGVAVAIVLMYFIPTAIINRRQKFSDDNSYKCALAVLRPVLTRARSRAGMRDGSRAASSGAWRSSRCCAFFATRTQEQALLCSGVSDVPEGVVDSAVVLRLPRNQQRRLPRRRLQRAVRRLAVRDSCLPEACCSAAASLIAQLAEFHPDRAALHRNLPGSLLRALSEPMRRLFVTDRCAGLLLLAAEAPRAEPAKG